MAEPAVTDPYWPPLSDLPQGECIMTTLYDEAGTVTGIRIDHADPRILISGELLDQLPTPHAQLDTSGCAPPPWRATYVGAVLKIHGVNRTVIYRITDYIPRVHGYIGEWPD